MPARYSRLTGPLAATLTFIVAAPPTPAAAEPETAASARWGSVDLLVGSMSSATGDLTLIGIGLRGGMIVHPALGFGLRLPIAHARGGGSAATSLGNLTIEGFYIVYRDRGVSDLAARAYVTASVSAPTASSAGERGATATAFTAFWIPEPGLYHPDATSARLAGTLAGTHGRKYFEGELDVQHLFIGAAAGDDATRSRLRITGGFSFTRHIGSFAAITSVWTVDPPADEDRLLHVAEAGFSAAGQAGGQARLSGYVPLDESYRDQLGAFGVVLAVAGTF